MILPSDQKEIDKLVKNDIIKFVNNQPELTDKGLFYLWICGNFLLGHILEFIVMIIDKKGVKNEKHH